MSPELQWGSAGFTVWVSVYFDDNLAIQVRGGKNIGEVKYCFEVSYTLYTYVKTFVSKVQESCKVGGMIQYRKELSEAFSLALLL